MKKVLLMSCCLSVATMAFAGAPVKVDSLRVINLQEVQVVSTRASEKTPMAFSNLTSKKIKSLNVGQDIPFLLRLTPSVVSSSDAGNGIGYTYIHIRGTDPTRVNITANGIPINDAESNQVYWTNMPDFASSLGSIQIQRGVGTSTNGGGAFGASVNMQTEALSNDAFAGFDGSAGSYGTHKETFKFGTGLLGNHWAFEGRLSNIGSDGYIARASAKLNSYFMQGGYIGDNTVVKFITFNGTERTYHAWDYASKEQMAKYGRTYNPCGEYLDADGKVAYYKDQTDDYHQQHYQLLWNQRMSENLNFNVALHYTHGYGYYEQYKDGWGHAGEKLYKYGLVSSLGSKSDLVRRKIMDNDFYGTVFSLNYQNEKLDASLGGGWNKYDGSHYGRVLWVRQFDGKLNPDQKYYDNDAKKRDGNIFAKVNYELVKGLNAYLDMQYRHVNYKMDGPSDSYDDNKKQIVYDVNTSYDFFNPKAGLYWTITPNHTLYASLAVAHKEPTRNDFEDNLSSQPKVERLTDWEAGYKYSGRQFSAAANFYYMHYNDQLVLTGEQNAIGELIARNVGKSYREGVELTAAYQPCKYFRWDANATFSRNRAKDWKVYLDDTGKYTSLGNTPLAYSPDVMVNNIFSFSHKGWNASLQSQYVGKQYLTNTGYKSYTDGNNEVSLMIDSYFVSNLDLSYTFKLPHIKSLTLGVTVFNLFGEKYESNGAASTQFKSGSNGSAMAYQDDYEDSYSVYSAQAPANFLAHLSLSF
jgi:iron complex outermembrane receptor protein